MRISILGAGDVSKISRFTSMSNEELSDLIIKIAEFLFEKGVELVIIPNKGIPLEIAKKYKQIGGNKVLGVVPTCDQDYGLAYIQDFLPIIDEKIEVNSWYDADGKIASQGDMCLVIGLSPGAIRALTALKFHQKYKGNKTKVFVFKNTLSKEIHKEISEEIPINYIENVKELRDMI